MNTKINKKSILDTLLSQIDEKSYKRTECKMMIATKIADALKEQGITQKHLATLLNKEPSEISKWLSGTHNFTIDTLSDIQDILNIKLINVDKEAKEYQPLVFCKFVTVKKKENIYNDKFTIELPSLDVASIGDC